MKIERDNAKLKSQAQSVSAVTDKKVTQASDSKFMQFMQDAQGPTYEQQLKQLAEDIFVQGDRLAKKIDVRELKAYKTLIMEFLNLAMQGEVRFSKQSKLDRRGRQKVFVTVKKINEEVETLTKEVLNNETDHLKILKKIEDIRGLILDIEM